jgi:shikimate dehydrogenase
MRRLAAVLGRDVSGSLSPLLHNAAAEQLNLPIAYVPVSCADTAKFSESVRALGVLGAVGANVTVPYKRAALAMAQEVSSTAQEIGAVNTLTYAEDRLQGDNTDGPGLVRALSRLSQSRFERVQILGAGGAARAVAWALARMGTREVVVTARRNAEPVAELAGGKACTLEAVPGATLVISTMPNDVAIARQALASWIDIGAKPLIYDLAYGTQGSQADDSPLVMAAKLEGLRALDGRVLLVEQAALSLSLWTGCDVARVRAVMGAALGISDPEAQAFDSRPGRV